MNLWDSTRAKSTQGEAENPSQENQNHTSSQTFPKPLQINYPESTFSRYGMRVDFYLYGHGDTYGLNSVFQLSVGSQSYGTMVTSTWPGPGVWDSSAWQEGGQYVKFTDVVVSAGQGITITVDPDNADSFTDGYSIICGQQIAPAAPPSGLPFIVNRPTNQLVAVGNSATFGATGGGWVPLNYQWLFNGVIIPGAINSSYTVTNVQAVNMGNYSVLVTNTYGQVTSVPGALWTSEPSEQSVIDVAFTDASVTTKTGLAEIGVAADDFWNTYNVVNTTNLSNLKFVNGTSAGADLTETGVYSISENGSSDPMYGNYAYASGNIVLTVTNLVTGTYDFYLYGHGVADNENSIFHLSVGNGDYGSAATTSGSGWLSSAWQEGVQYVEFQDVLVPAQQPITITAEPGVGGVAVLSGLQVAYISSMPAGPSFLSQPSNQSVYRGLPVTFSILSIGAEPLAYQWLFNGTTISEATNSGFTLTNAELTNIGTYSVIVANAYGSVTSAVATLNVQPMPSLINVAFTSFSVTSKTGEAATGETTTDFWNTYVLNSLVLPGLEFANGTESGAGLTVTGANDAFTNDVSDLMYSDYLYPSAGGNITVTITNLTSGVYDFYLYGHGNANKYNSVFQLTVGTASYGGKATTDGSTWSSPVWQEGVQYVLFNGISVSPGQTITITVKPGASIYAVLSGIQISPVGPPSGDLYIVTPPANQTVTQGATTTFSVLAGGVSPFSYQWLLNNSDITDATNGNYTVTNAQYADAGSYSVIVSNAYGSVPSSSAQLGVAVAGVSMIDVALTPASMTTKKGFAATGISSNDFWNTCSGLSTNLQFVDGTYSGTGLTISSVQGASTNSVADPMYGIYYFNQDEVIIISVTNLIAGAYNFFIYGHGNENSGNSSFQLTEGTCNSPVEYTTNGPGWNSPIWQKGIQYVEFTDFPVAAQQNITIVVYKGADGFASVSGLQIALSNLSSNAPFVVNQALSQTAIQARTSSFAVLVSGTMPLAYQWLFKNDPISGATNSSYAIANVEPANSGGYSVIITNSYGSVTSSTAPLNVIAPDFGVINLAVNSPVTGKIGFAATGITTNDFWNAFPAGSGVITNLLFTDRTPSGAGVSATPGLPAGYTGSSDQMYDLYAYNSANIVLTVTNLMAGAYDIYLYGHGNDDNQNSIFQLSEPSLTFGSETTTNGPGWLSPAWQEGVQYVEFTNINVDAGQALTIIAEPGANGYSYLSGLQIVPTGSPSSVAAIAEPPVSQVEPEGTNVVFTVLAGGAPPFSYQWFFNGAAIADATKSDYVVSNAAFRNNGSYWVVVSNAYNSITSTVAGLTVYQPMGALIDVAFAQSIATGKRGFAATGIANNDFWNTFSSLANGFSNYRLGSYPNNIYWSLTNLLFSDGVISDVGMNVTMIDYPVSGTNGASDPMYGVYLYGVFAGGGYLEVTNLASGTYDFYLYGHGGLDEENTVYQLSAGSQSYGSEATINGPALEDLEDYGWEEGVQYVKFAGVSVSNGQSVAITFEPAATQYFGVVSGLQIAYVGQAAIVAQPADQPAIPGSIATFNVGAIGASPIVYQWLFDNTVIAAATGQGFTVTDANTNNVGSYSVIVSNVYGSVTSAVATLKFVSLPTITSMPASQLVFQGSNAIFSVSDIGATPLAYQWMFNYSPIGAATNSTFGVTNAQPDDSGDYSVIVSNDYASVTSAVATLNVRIPIFMLIDVAFTGASLTGKSGFAATGLTSNDFWNTYVANSPGLLDLLSVDTTASGVNLTVTNTRGSAQQFSANGASDPMYGVYLSEYVGDIGIIVSNLVAGTYDFYLYGENSIFYLKADSWSYGSEATTNDAGWLSPIWQKGSQYVEFTNVIITANQPIAITVGGSTALSGMQIAMPESSPFINTQPNNQSVPYSSTTTFSVLAGGTTPLAYQWQFNNANILAATNSTYTLANVQPANAGEYSVVVTNQYGSVTSAVAVLTVITPLVTGIAYNGNATITLNLESLPNTSVRIWTATNLDPPVVWTAVFTNGNTGTSGQWQFTDTNTVNFGERFYRFSTP